MLRYIACAILGASIVSSSFASQQEELSPGTQNAVEIFKQLVEARESKTTQKELQPIIERLAQHPYEDMQERIDKIFSRLDAKFFVAEECKELCKTFINDIKDRYERKAITTENFFKMLNHLFVLSVVPSLDPTANLPEAILDFSYGLDDLKDYISKAEKVMRLPTKSERELMLFENGKYEEILESLSPAGKSLLNEMMKTYYNSPVQAGVGEVESVRQWWNYSHRDQAVTNEEYLKCNEIFQEVVMGITKAMKPLLFDIYDAYEKDFKIYDARAKDGKISDDEAKKLALDNVVRIMQEYYNQGKVTKEEIERCRKMFKESTGNYYLPEIE